MIRSITSKESSKTLETMSREIKSSTMKHTHSIQRPTTCRANLLIPRDKKIHYSLDKTMASLESRIPQSTISERKTETQSSDHKLMNNQKLLIELSITCITMLRAGTKIDNRENRISTPSQRFKDQGLSHNLISMSTIVLIKTLLDLAWILKSLMSKTQLKTIEMMLESDVVKCPSSSYHLDLSVQLLLRMSK